MSNDNDKSNGKMPPHQQRRSDAALQRAEKSSSMYLRGKTYREIAKELGVCLDTARKDVKRARRMWRSRAERSYAKHLHEQLAKLDECECAAWLGWQRSLRDELQTGTEDGIRGEHTVDVTKISRTSKSGNASFLKIIMDVIRQRSELLGLMDEETRNAAADDQSQVVTVVVDTREEAAEFSTLNFTDFKEKFAEPTEAAG